MAELLAFGAPADLPDEYGELLYKYRCTLGGHHAPCRSTTVSHARMLASARCLPRTKRLLHLLSSTGVTPIAKAAMNGHTAVVNELLAKGAEVKRVVEGDLTTPLLLAAANGHVDAVLRLLAAGASVEDRDAEERSPLILAGLAGSAALIKVGSPVLTLDLRHCNALARSSVTTENG